mmetsp:Transcript_12048/g.14982  ORF Transcript_12048/g.14982 Transcript_12048/m.14982 type:complete len:107 (-) Transcript_12048:1627-1947(-)
MLPIAWMSIPVLARNLANTYVPNIQSTLTKPSSPHKGTGKSAVEEDNSDTSPDNHDEGFPNLFSLTSGKFRSVYTSKGRDREQLQAVSRRTKDRLETLERPARPSF